MMLLRSFAESLVLLSSPSRYTQKESFPQSLLIQGIRIVLFLNLEPLPQQLASPLYLLEINKKLLQVKWNKFCLLQVKKL